MSDDLSKRLAADFGSAIIGYEGGGNWTIRDAIANIHSIQNGIAPSEALRIADDIIGKTVGGIIAAGYVRSVTDDEVAVDEITKGKEQKSEPYEKPQWKRDRGL